MISDQEYRQGNLLLRAAKAEQSDPERCDLSTSSSQVDNKNFHGPDRCSEFAFAVSKDPEKLLALLDALLPLVVFVSAKKRNH